MKDESTFVVNQIAKEPQLVGVSFNAFLQLHKKAIFLYLLNNHILP